MVKKMRAFAFNVFNIEMVNFIISKAKKMDVQVIIQTSTSFLKTIDIKYFAYQFHCIKTFHDYEPVLLHLDHCKDIDLIKLCYMSGWDSVLFDGSHLPLRENILKTKEVKKIAVNMNKLLEGELNPIYGIEDDIIENDEYYTTIQDAKVYCEETNIDWFAPAVGTYHGLNINKKANVNFDLLDQISMETKKPLVLHGGSGLKNSDFSRAFDCGVHKINVSTELKNAFISTIEEFNLNVKKDVFNFNKLFESRMEGVLLSKFKISKGELL